jgi:HSP20 family protein
MNISDLVPWRSQTPARRRNDEPFQMMQREMNRLFEDFFRDFESSTGLARGFGEGSQLSAFTPSVNISEGDEAFEATVELPGMSEEDIDVSLSRDGLTITGEKKEEAEDEQKNFYRRERSYGYFRRTIPLPQGAIDEERVEATFDKGVLKVTLPKRQEAQQTRRQISVKSAQ